ncbi:hypothetical protein D3C81_828460 [compost metagenome]
MRAIRGHGPLLHKLSPPAYPPYIARHEKGADTLRRPPLFPRFPRVRSRAYQR